MRTKLSTVYYPQTSGGYTVICPELNGVTEGKTYEEARKNILEVIKLLIEDYEDKNDLAEAFDSGSKIFTEVEIEY
ncbi:MAG: type II toxin-antitoxin system HicB family antitoxin [Oscillospiraceae bacterium]|nr:type II toxin-antitoxin system HicB family antitoxin [Oscillospiraceae bacterium]